MAVLTKDLEIIKGYGLLNIGDKIYKQYYTDDMDSGSGFPSLYFKPVMESIIRCFDLMNKVLYPDVDITEELNTLRNGDFAKEFRTAIYDVIQKFATAAGKNLKILLGKIKLAHFGSDIREPLYDALIKLGADGDMYYQTVAEDYIWRKESGNVILVRYLAEDHPFIITPQTIDGSPVTEISPFTFDNHEELMGVRIPSGTTTI